MAARRKKGRKQKGKSMQKLKKVVEKQLAELNEKPEIVIDKDIVDKNLKQNTTTSANASIIEIDSSQKTATSPNVTTIEADSSIDESNTAHETTPQSASYQADNESSITDNSSVQNISTIVVDSDDESDDDVVFVQQYKRLTISPRSKYAALEKKSTIYSNKLQKRNRNYPACKMLFIRNKKPV